jgi:hypothetical protein
VREYEKEIRRNEQEWNGKKHSKTNGTHLSSIAYCNKYKSKECIHVHAESLL